MMLRNKREKPVRGSSIFSKYEFVKKNFLPAPSKRIP